MFMAPKRVSYRISRDSFGLKLVLIDSNAQGLDGRIIWQNVPRNPVLFHGPFGILLKRGCCEIASYPVSVLACECGDC